MSDRALNVRRISTPNSAEQAKLAAIRALISQQRLDEAERALEKLLTETPKSYSANYNMGRLLYRRREFDRATGYLEAARKIDPTRSEPTLLAGTAYLRSDAIDNAADCFQAALEIDPKLANAHAGLAQVYFRRDKVDEAEECVAQALALDPQLQEARTLLVRIHQRQGKPEESKQVLVEMAGARPDQPRPAIALARKHLQNREPEQAIAILQMATEQRADSVELRAMLGRAHAAAGDHAGAEQAYRKALELDPRQRLIAGPLVRALTAQGKLQEAKQLLDKMPGRARQNPRFHVAYGDVHMADKRYDLAAASYRAALMHRTDGKLAVSAPANNGDDDPKAVAEYYRAALSDLRSGQDDEEVEGDPAPAPKRSRVARVRQQLRARR